MDQNEDLPRRIHNGLRVPIPIQAFRQDRRRNAANLEEIVHIGPDFGLAAGRVLVCGDHHGC